VTARVAARLAEIRQWLGMHNRLTRLNHAREKAGQEPADIETVAKALLTMENAAKKSAAAREELRIAREWLA
jgi:hypothetical protein